MDRTEWCQNDHNILLDDIEHLSKENYSIYVLYDDKLHNI